MTREGKNECKNENEIKNEVVSREAVAGQEITDSKITIEVLNDGADGQFQKLEDSYLSEIGEDILTGEKKEQLARAVADGRITFFIAKHGCQMIGMCSVATAFSTFACSEVGTFEDFYVEPVFRRQGVARKLTEAARQWCSEKGVVSLTVTCAPCDEAMYQTLGFELELGRTYAMLVEES